MTDDWEDGSEELKLSTEIMVWAFYIFIPAKTIAFDYGIFHYIVRYLETYKVWCQAEIWILILTAIKVTVLCPDYFLYEINWLFYVFVVNSGTTFWLSHVLHMRGCIIKQKPKMVVRGFKFLTFTRFSLLFIILFLSPFLDQLFTDSKGNYEYRFLFTCNPDQVYPIRFALIFCLDVFSAAIDLMIFSLSPRIEKKQSLIKEVRVADIFENHKKRTE